MPIPRQKAKCFFSILVILFFTGLIIGCIGTDTAGSRSSGPATSSPDRIVTGTIPAPGTGNPEAIFWSDKAWALNAQGKYQEASDAVDKAKALDPDNPNVLTYKGWALAGLGRYEEALVVLDKALAADPNDGIALFNKGFSLYNLGRCQEAFLVFTTGITLHPSDHVFEKFRALTLEKCTASVTPQGTTTPRNTVSAATGTTMGISPGGTTATPGQPMGSPVVESLGSVWIVKEYGSMGNYDGVWTRRPGSGTFDASWSGDGSATDVIDFVSLKGDQITLYRQGNGGYYTGTVSSSGTRITGKGSWYTTGETWTVSIPGGSL